MAAASSTSGSGASTFPPATTTPIESASYYTLSGIDADGFVAPTPAFDAFFSLFGQKLAIQLLTPLPLV